MHKKVTAQQIIDNINVRLALLREQGFDGLRHAPSHQLQDLLDDISRHNSFGVSIDVESTLKISCLVQIYQDDHGQDDDE